LKKLLIAAIILCLCTAALAQEGETPSPPGEEEIRALIKSLGAESWKERREAEKKLVEAGRAAGPALEEAAASEDLEVAHRARKILDEIAYLPEETQKKVDKLIEQLKSKKLAERDAAFEELSGMDKRTLIYLGKYLGTPSDNKVEVKIALDRQYSTSHKQIDYKVVIKNAGEKPVWIPGPEISEKGSYVPFGANEGAINWSRGFSARSSEFKFIHLTPGETYEIEKQFRPYGNYSGRHTINANFHEVSGTTVTTKSGEKVFLAVKHFSLKEPVTAEVIHLPRLEEAKKGRPYGNLSASLEMEATEMEKGGKLDIKFKFYCHGSKPAQIDGELTKSLWYVLLKADKEPEYAANGLLSMKTSGEAPQEYIVKPGGEFEFKASFKPEIEPGEYMLVCGYTELRPSGSRHFRGEVVTNAVKIKIKETTEDK